MRILIADDQQARIAHTEGLLLGAGYDSSSMLFDRHENVDQLVANVVKGRWDVVFMSELVEHFAPGFHEKLQAKLPKCRIQTLRHPLTKEQLLAMLDWKSGPSPGSLFILTRQ